MIEIANIIKKNSKIIHIDPRPAEVEETLADIESTVKDLSWYPKYSLEDIVNDY